MKVGDLAGEIEAAIRWSNAPIPSWRPNRKKEYPMPQPSFTMRQLLEAGVHFGHHTRRWNPKMEKFIFGKRNNIHILDLQQTVPMLYQALEMISQTAARGGRILFVGTKPAAAEVIAQAARSCGQYCQSPLAWRHDD